MAAPNNQATLPTHLVIHFQPANPSAPNFNIMPNTAARLRENILWNLNVIMTQQAYNMYSGNMVRTAAGHLVPKSTRRWVVPGRLWDSRRPPNRLAPRNRQQLLVMNLPNWYTVSDWYGFDWRVEELPREHCRARWAVWCGIRDLALNEARAPPPDNGGNPPPPPDGGNPPPPPDGGNPPPPDNGGNPPPPDGGNPPPLDNGGKSRHNKQASGNPKDTTISSPIVQSSGARMPMLSMFMTMQSPSPRQSRENTPKSPIGGAIVGGPIRILTTSIQDDNDDDDDEEDPDEIVSPGGPSRIRVFPHVEEDEMYDYDEEEEEEEDEDDEFEGEDMDVNSEDAMEE
ncbi:hypothetical protein BJ508DRAFT_332828 [Ascobolus immersus RN42]|uniref:Uncharacterized protein n=1 Tax=Ascobolus immersus RN42 TaxID=1160509 RepID=A0A3N4HLI1_ASCIM|nr:hypothetical protein BJ508DRAFT_332828 [Ascobolus immersus RN42]